MNYEKLYNSIIKKALLEQRTKKDCYYEVHHIIPKCMGGNNDKNNLVHLTGREHYLCHYLLTKIYDNSELVFAFNMMHVSNSQQIRHFNSRLYESNKKKVSKIVGDRNTLLFSGENNPRFGYSNICANEKIKQWHNNMSKDQKEKRAKTISNNTKLAMDKLSDDKKYEMRRNQFIKQYGFHFILVKDNENEFLFETKKDANKYNKNLNKYKMERVKI